MELEVTPPELPQDVLMDIFALLEIPDLVRAASVCPSWCSANTSLQRLGQYKRPQTPCLLYTSETDGESDARLYSLVEKRSYKLTLPEPPIRGRYLIGSSNGWLVTVDDRSEMHLLNPITWEQIVLPSVITLDPVAPIFDETVGVVTCARLLRRAKGLGDDAALFRTSWRCSWWRQQGRGRSGVDALRPCLRRRSRGLVVVSGGGGPGQRP
ncbi:hypothetical protein QYE76_001118 [Lolium multiflorum]|uniref:F-box domain-containing protein n=1 Tax=Lolium multiflorum TaxID=4521 RepID=A0AAD8RJ46_LOLMU|nr:hypothetical protein QYE76_001118 [Lolium multiflorum]